MDTFLTSCGYFPSSCSARRLDLTSVRVLENRLVLLHKTEVPDVPLAMQEFQGRLLVGVGKSLRVSTQFCLATSDQSELYLYDDGRLVVYTCMLKVAWGCIYMLKGTWLYLYSEGCLA